VAQFGLITAKTIVGGDLHTFSADVQHNVHMLAILGNGFILTTMLWGGAVALLIDRKLILSSIFWYVCAF
jgi:hypothetical protein